MLCPLDRAILMPFQTEGASPDYLQEIHFLLENRVDNLIDIEIFF